MKLFNWLSTAIVVSSLLLLTGCPSPAPQKQKVQYASAKSKPDNAASPAQPDKNLKLQKITLAWTQPGKVSPLWSYKLHQGGSSGTFTNSVLTFSTNAIVYVWPGQTYYFDVILITDKLDPNGLQITVHCVNPTELAYTVPNKPGGGPK